MRLQRNGGTMLDDLRYIHERDGQDALGVVGKQWQQLNQDLTATLPIKVQAIQNIVYAGMGGSALAALMAQVWPALKLPFIVVRDYNLPAFVGKDTLVIVASYSGNTEETLSALAEAQDKGASIVVIAGGGKLQEAAQAGNYPMVLLPKAEQPRYAVLANFKALLTILEAVDALQDSKIMAALPVAAKFLEQSIAAWTAEVPTAKNLAKQIALELMGKSIVVYSGPKLSAAAYKWKISFNENAKHVAWVNQLSEFNHNEFIGWSKQPVDKPYAVIDLRSNLEHPRIQKRFEVGARMLSGLRPEPIVVQAQGKTLLEQMLYTSAFGDFVSIYLALLSGINPAPVDLVEKFKKALDA